MPSVLAESPSTTDARRKKSFFRNDLEVHICWRNVNSRQLEQLKLLSPAASQDQKRSSVCPAFGHQTQMASMHIISLHIGKQRWDPRATTCIPSPSSHFCKGISVLFWLSDIVGTPKALTGCHKMTLSLTRCQRLEGITSMQKNGITRHFTWTFLFFRMLIDFSPALSPTLPTNIARRKNEHEFFTKFSWRLSGTEIVSSTARPEILATDTTQLTGQHDRAGGSGPCR